MSCENTEYWRIISKYSTISGATPSIPPSQDHTDGTWSPTDLYVGEFFVNVADDLIWVRTINGILPLGVTAGGTSSYIGDYVSKSLGGTYSGGIYAPTMSSITFTGTNFIGDNFNGGNFTGTFSGDGSGLTGITAVWTGGTVSNPVYFTNTLDLTNDLTIDGSISTNNSYIDIQNDLWVNGGVSSSYFVGDGSLLTNLPIGATSNDYTIDAYLDGYTLKFDRTDLSDAYSVDLEPIIATNSITGVNFDGTFYTIYLTDGTEWQVDMTTFNSLSITGAITADEFNGGTFNGTFVGTYSNDIYTTGVVLVGNEEIFTRTDGSTYSVDLSSLVVSGATPSLSDVLSVSELAGTHNIYFPNGWGVRSSGGVTSSTGLGFDNDSIFLHAGTGSVDDYGSRAVISATKVGSVAIGVENDVEFNMNLGGLGAGLFTIYGYVGFNGAEYGADYSTNYTNRSLVDKEYVDNAVSGAGGTLEETLALGNTTGTHSILVESGYGIKHNTDNTVMVEYGNDGLFDYVSVGDTTSSTFRVRKDCDWRIDQTLGSLNTSVSSTLGDGTIDISATDGTTSASISVQSVGEINIVGLLQNPIDYRDDNSSLFTNRSLVDKEYVDNAVSGAFIYITEDTVAGTLTMSAPTSITSTVTDGISDTVETITTPSQVETTSTNGTKISTETITPVSMTSMITDGTFTQSIYIDSQASKNVIEVIKGTDITSITTGDTGSNGEINMLVTDGANTSNTQQKIDFITSYVYDSNTDISDTITLDPQGLGDGTGIISYDITNDIYSQTTYIPTSITSTVTDGSKSSQVFADLDYSTLLHTEGEGPRDTIVRADYDNAQLAQIEGAYETRLQVSIAEGFYQSQSFATGISKGVSKTQFVSLQTDDDTIISVVWPLSGLEVGTTAVGIKATVTALNADEDKAYVAELYAAVRMNAYAVTIFGGVDKLEKTEFTTATSTIEIESSSVAIRVTGEAATTIYWSVKYELIYSVV